MSALAACTCKLTFVVPDLRAVIKPAGVTLATVGSADEYVIGMLLSCRDASFASTVSWRTPLTCKRTLSGTPLRIRSGCSVGLVELRQAATAARHPTTDAARRRGRRIGQQLPVRPIRDERQSSGLELTERQRETISVYSAQLKWRYARAERTCCPGYRGLCGV